MNRVLFLGGGAVAVALSAYITVVSFKDVPSAAGAGDGGAMVLANFDASVVVEKPLPVPVLDFDASAVPATANALTLGGDAGTVENTTGTGSNKSVRFGVILLQFAGAQDAPTSARSKSAAKQLADKLAVEAKANFHDAVNHGDSGSIDDAGRMHRGVLEAETERVLFGLASGEISEPMETPRGYWIVKRLD